MIRFTYLCSEYVELALVANHACECGALRELWPTVPNHSDMLHAYECSQSVRNHWLEWYRNIAHDVFSRFDSSGQHNCTSPLVCTGARLPG